MSDQIITSAGNDLYYCLRARFNEESSLLNKVANA